ADRAMFWGTEGQPTDLNRAIPARSGWILERALDINDDGWIVGYGTLNGNRRSFMLVPIPAREFAIRPASPNSQKDKRAIGSILLSEPAAADTLVELSSERTGIADPLWTQLIIPKGGRLAVFPVSINAVRET